MQKVEKVIGANWLDFPNIWRTLDTYIFVYALETKNLTQNVRLFEIETFIFIYYSAKVQFF